MKQKYKLLLILSSVAVTGCATTYTQGPVPANVGPFNVQVDQMVPGVVTEIVTNPVGYGEDQITGFATAALGQTIDDPFILASNIGSFATGVAGPNKVSEAIFKGMNWYRLGLGFLEQPLQSLMIYTPWLKN